MTLFILGIILAVVALFIPRKVTSDGTEYSIAPVKFGVLTFGFLLGVSGLLWASYYSVPAGHRGVLLQYGAVKGNLSEGMNWVTPFIQGVEIMEVRTQKEEAQAAAASKDLQNVHTSVAINYHIDPRTVGDLYKNVGLGYGTRIIDPAVQETVKAVVANYTAEELVKLRSEVKSRIDTALTDRLAKYNILVEPQGVSLTNFDFSPEFNKAIESKQVAQQTAEKQKYVLQQAKMEAETAIATAEGRAKANAIEAAALNAQGGQKVLTRLWIEKWDGKLPLMGGGSNTMIDVRSLMDAGAAK